MMIKRMFSKMSVGLIVTNAVRLILVLGFISSFYRGRELAMAFTIVAFIATFIPKILARFDVQTGAEMQVVVLLIVYGSLFLGEIRGLFAYLWWWDVLLKSVAGLALGFIGLTVILAFEEQELLDASPFMIITLSFALSFTLGSLWEIVEFSLDNIFDFALQRIGTGIMAHDLIIDAVTALVVSAGGYLYKKRAGGNPMSGFIVRLMKGNPKIFRSQKHLESSSDKIKSIIQKGEGPKLEFKSSLRTNLYTNAIDKNIEYSVLKTLVAYLNTDGGMLVVGVSDKGDILGLEKDAFPSSDKLKLHFNNMIKEHIGAQFMNFINYELFEIDGKSVLKIECLPSTKRVFLKENGQEEFYMRNGPSTMRLSGSALIDYITQKFNTS
ncbi:MAG: ATP-binding protein [Nanoarchaeota archaeon]